MVPRVVKVLAGLMLLPATAELAVLVVNPTPRAQVVRPGPDLTVRQVDGVPLWQVADSPEAATDCAHPRPRWVLLAGDSVLYATEMNAQDGRAWRGLQALLPDDVCVADVSQPGYRAYQQLTAARGFAATHDVAAVVFQVFKTSARYTPVGDGWIDATQLRTDDDGVPTLGLVPPGLNRWLLERSGAWEFATLALASTTRGGIPPETDYDEALAWLTATGIPGLMLEVPLLREPFATSADHRAPWRRELSDRAAAQHVATLVLADAWRDEDVTAVRLDLCCHYNRAGHAALAATLAPAVETLLSPPPAVTAPAD